MKKYEHLFSQDPIGAFEKIEEDFTRYFDVSYKISNVEINKERMDALRANNNLSKEPYIEVLPEYAPADGLNTMDDLIKRFSPYFGSETYAKEYFEELISKGLMQGLMDKYIPYGHQIGMLEKAFAGIDEKGNPLKYKNTVITSGTGSGKTESFMLPLLADIYKEYVISNWEQAESHINWYDGIIEGRSTKKRYVPNQRLNDPRPAAIRALVLYPMNALVEDQMARLREALDSNEVRAFMQKRMKGNRIYFGSYNGSTIAPKSYNLLNDPDHKTAFTKRKQEVAEQLAKIHEHFEFVNNYVANNPEKKDALYIEPRLGGELTTSEMITRWDMQYWSPDIMITNTSMLSIMLMRRAESQMFEDTKRWLAAKDLPECKREEAKKNRIFHIIVDELHLYRGTAGSEVACLLRMLYNAIGLEPVIDDGCGHKVPNPQIKILASSASLGDETATQKYMEEFFGIYSTIEGETVFNVQAGSNYTGENKGVDVDYVLFSEFNHENFVAIELDSEKADNVEDIRKEKVLNFLKTHFECDTVDEFCKKYEEQMFRDFYDCLPSNTDGSKRPIAQSLLVESLFAGNKDAYRGFLIFRGYIDTIYKKHKLPRFRFHKFFKYVEGLWGELNPSLSDDVPAVKNLSYNPKEVGARKVLELLRCENCGQLFIGGNRKKEICDGSVSLTLNFPNLEQIPNFNPTPMVQNKTYQDYAIFWPKDLNKPINIPEGSANQGGGDHVVVINTGECAYSNGKAQWVSGYLDSLTGRFTPKDNSIAANTGSLKEEIRDNGIQGFLYRVVNNNNGEEIDELRASKIYAAPCTCPNCLQDYTLRKYTNSPIRSFRTGIDRSNQILSKELLYQLDDNSSKLIGFSDSREDAAKQALGIEKEQYRDMVRMLFVECVNEVGINDIVDFVKQQLANGEKRKDIRDTVKTKWLRPDISDITNDIFDAIDDDDFSCLSQYSQNNIPLSNLIGNGFDGTLVRKLLERGINPAGEAHKFQWYGKDNAEGLYHWSTAYDFSAYTLVNNPHFEDNTYVVQIRKQLENAVFANSFGKYMGVSVLDAGIGYISGPQSDAIEASNEYQKLRTLLPADISVYEFVDAFIRVMGDNYLYPSVEEGNAYVDYEHLKGSVKRPVKIFCERRGVDENTLGDALVRYLKKYCTDINVLSLELEKLSFTKMTSDKYVKCKYCGRVHPNNGFGFCTNTSCMKPLDPSVTIDTEVLHNHYISFDILTEKKTPRRLHTEELSGQTDDIQARLREFKDLIIIDDNDPTKLGKEITMPIDMVCVTTTMEVGVDIGSLQAIFQGNMPPTRYNYQQRVGRGGRRGQAYSTAFTFCRGRSHDVYYYEKATDEMVGGIPATPTLSLAPFKDTNGEVRMKKAIMKRVVVKEILHQAFLKLDYQYDLQDTAGEFGRIADWSDNINILKKWIKENNDAVEGIVYRYFDQFNMNGQIKKDIQEIIDWINDDNKMVAQINNVVQKTSNQDMGLASYLLEAGFLPMYGMPSDSRNFYHGFDSVSKRVKSVDRSSEIAISEFAPGSEKTKDKGKYRVEGLTIPMIDEANDRGQISFYDPNGDALSDRYILSYIKNIGENNNNIKEIIEAPIGVSPHQIQLTDKQRLIVIPQAYRSLQIRGNTGIPVENNDKGSSFTQSQIFARDNSSSSLSSNKKTVGNVDISVYEMGLNEDPTVWHVNNNNNRFYTGAYSANGLEMPYGRTANFMFFDKYNTNGRTETSRKDQDPQNTIDIALGSKKITEMIKLELKSYPSVLNLSLETGNRSAIRAAFYSAAFLLQRALADKLDVQPDEVEICEKIDDKFEYPSLYLSDALPNGAGIVSYLYQDGKLEELIRSIVTFDSFDLNKTSKEKSFMQSIISEEHMCNCLTACQKCMLTYSNRGFHHILDWRLGVGLLRLMLDESYDFGFDLSTRSSYEELSDWDYIIHACARKFNLTADSKEQYYWIKDGLCTLFYHPLWNREKVIENVSDQYNSLRMYNTFKVLRSDMLEDKDERMSSRPQLGVSRLNRIKRQNKPTPPSVASPSTSPSDDDDDIIL